MELAEILRRRGKFDEAESLVRESLEIRRANPRGQDFQIAHTLEQLHAVLTLAGKDDDAEPVLHELVEAYRAVLPAEGLTAAWVHLGSGLWLQQRGRTERAEAYFREAVRVYRLNPNPPREMYLLAVNGLFQILRKREADFDETMALFHEAIENMQFVYGRDHLLIAPHLLGFAQELEKRERAAEAIPLIVDGIRINRKAKGDDWDATASLEMLERFVRRVVLAPGLSHDRYRTVATGAELLVTEKPNDASCGALLGMAKYRLGKWNDARKNLAPAADAISQQPPENRPQQLAFLAMTQFRSGEVEKAHMTLGQVRELLADESIVKSKDNRTAFAEAEALISTKRVD
jgi:tetratricopeptide (TPR) repeat protein